MNDEVVIKKIIRLIEDKERELQASKLISSSQAKTDVVQMVLKELDLEFEKESGHENQKN